MKSMRKGSYTVIPSWKDAALSEKFLVFYYNFTLYLPVIFVTFAIGISYISYMVFYVSNVMNPP